MVRRRSGCRRAAARDGRRRVRAPSRSGSDQPERARRRRPRRRLVRDAQHDVGHVDAGGTVTRTPGASAPRTAPTSPSRPTAPRGSRTGRCRARPRAAGPALTSGTARRSPRDGARVRPGRRHCWLAEPRVTLVHGERSTRCERPPRGDDTPERLRIGVLSAAACTQPSPRSARLGLRVPGSANARGVRLQPRLPRLRARVRAAQRRLAAGRRAACRDDRWIATDRATAAATTASAELARRDDSACGCSLHRVAARDRDGNGYAT